MIEEEEEWIEDDQNSSPATTQHRISALRNRLEEALPVGTRPGFLEMTEATHTLSNLVKTFSGSSGSLSLNASPYKKREAPEHAASPRGLYGILEADEATMFRTSPTHLGHIRHRLTSLASIVSTEANSSFEDSEELQKLLDSIMAADLGSHSCDTVGSREDSGGDMALLSPFGSPAEYRDSRIGGVGDSGGTEKHCSWETFQTRKKSTSTTQPHAPAMLPPPKFLLNDRPISPPDSMSLSESTHGHVPDESGGTVVKEGQWVPWASVVDAHMRNGEHAINDVCGTGIAGSSE